jgi:hypothetical protein
MAGASRLLSKIPVSAAADKVPAALLNQFKPVDAW